MLEPLKIGNREPKTFLLYKANLDTDVYNLRFLI
jgi:hypothetical protein